MTVVTLMVVKEYLAKSFIGLLLLLLYYYYYHHHYHY
jgi:hypothetical protein